jgi:hypothetical protein
MTSDSDPTTPADDSLGSRSIVTYGTDETVLDGLDRSAWEAGGVGPTGMVWVSGSGGPDDAISQLRDAELTGMPDSLTVISLDDCGRSATTQESGSAGTTVPFEPSELTVHALAPEADLEDLGVAIMESVQDLETLGYEIVIVLDDLGTVLSDTSLERVYQFLHILTGKSDANGWTVRIGLDPSDVDDRTLTTLTPLFDSVD